MSKIKFSGLFFLFGAGVHYFLLFISNKYYLVTGLEGNKLLGFLAILFDLGAMTSAFFMAILSQISGLPSLLQLIENSVFPGLMNGLYFAIIGVLFWKGIHEKTDFSFICWEDI